MTAREAEEQRTLIEALKLAGFLVIRVNSGRSSYSIRYNYWTTSEVPASGAGLADLLALSPEGQWWIIEVKKKGGIYSHAQINFRNEVTARGGIVLTVEEVYENLAKGI